MDMDNCECPSLALREFAPARAKSTRTSDILNSLEESSLKFSIADKGGFARWPGQGGHYQLLPAKKNNTWNSYDAPSWLYINVKSSFILDWEFYSPCF